MESPSLIFTIAFFSVFVGYGIFGGYIIHMNPKERLNRVFFLMCISLCFWSIGFAVGTSAPDVETSLFWHKIAALGWGTSYSLLLHFILILTKHQAVLKKWWLYIVLYVPAAIVVYIFAIQSFFPQYSLYHSTFGWLNMSVQSAWDWFFNIYFVSFSLAGIFLLGIHTRRSPDLASRKQAKMFFISLIISMLIGSFTDIIFTYTSAVTIPQLAPVIIIIPVAVIYYSIHHFGLMAPIQSNQDEMILNEPSRSKAYNYISLSFFIAAVFSFFSEYFLFSIWGFANALSFSLSLLCIGLAIQIIRRLKMKEDHKDIAHTILLAAAIPVITLRFVEFASITTWAFPIIIIVFSLVFNKRYILTTVAISVLFTQVLVWFLAPTVSVTVDATDYLGRICIFCLALAMAFYVHKIYILRLKENSEQNKLQTLISEISSEFVTVNLGNLEEKIISALEKSGKYIQVDRAFGMLFDQELATMTYRYEWCGNGTGTAIGSFNNTPIDQYRWMMEKIQLNQTVQISDINMLPQEAYPEKTELGKRSVCSLIAAPIRSKNKSLGFLGFCSNKNRRVWRNNQVLLTEVLSNIFSDAFAKVEAEKEINNMAYFDHLTKLPNRLMFKDRVDQAIALADRMHKKVGIMFLDLDSFKNVNDTMGHEGGDELLKTISDVLLENVRKSDTISRFGGDEFIIMLNQVESESDINRIADHIMSLFNKPIKISNQEFFITVSAGIAMYPADGEDTETLIKNADIAMYSAKAKGKNQYVLCTREMKEQIHQKMIITNYLYRAQERNELMVYYQPQVSLISGHIIGLEALLRWRHPELGLVPPLTFIPLAEQTGLINSIGEWVLMTACRQNKKWQDMGLPQIRMAVNVSVNQFRNPDLVGQIKKVLSKTGLDPQYLELEITESIAINESDYIIDVLNNLKKIGLTISIDDFGTEYSSLSRLKLLPIDRLKMDMQFVQGIEGGNKDQAITKVIINLAKNLGIKVIAEGVETERQLAFLSQRMCDEVQGFYYYKPMPAEQLEPILRRGKLSTVIS